MLTDELFNSVLIEPATKGANKLLIVSGFATANMADKHIKDLTERDTTVSISLIVGMARNGVDKIQHRAFQELTQHTDKDFCCYYLVKSNPCHSKVFIWQDNEKAIKAFVGSANYTRQGFGGKQLESMTETDPVLAQQYFYSLYPLCLPCVNDDIENNIPVIELQKTEQYNDDKVVTLSLLDSKTGDTHKHAGLNWGQREGREKNQAYIPVPKKIRKREFFPPRGEQFTVLTDDDASFILAIAQDDGKALHSTENNSILGRYFRNRIGVPFGARITNQHLKKYGRSDVSFYRIDSDTYYMNFSSAS